MFSRMRMEKKRSSRKLTGHLRDEIAGMTRDLHCSPGVWLRLFPQIWEALCVP